MWFCIVLPFTVYIFSWPKHCLFLPVYHLFFLLFFSNRYSTIIPDYTHNISYVTHHAPVLIFFTVLDNIFLWVSCKCPKKDGLKKYQDRKCILHRWLDTETLSYVEVFIQHKRKRWLNKITEGCVIIVNWVQVKFP